MQTVVPVILRIFCVIPSQLKNDRFIGNARVCLDIFKTAIQFPFLPLVKIYQRWFAFAIVSVSAMLEKQKRVMMYGIMYI